MTAGGGWLDSQLRARPGLMMLPVRGADVVVQVARCTGDCCRMTIIGTNTGLPGGINPEELAALGAASARGETWRNRDGARCWPAKDGDVIADMMVSIGVRQMPLGGEGHYYRCRHHDPVSGDCRIYERRPRMCSSHALRDPCSHESCAMRIQVNPLVLRDLGVPPQVLPDGWGEPVERWVEQTDALDDGT